MDRENKEDFTQAAQRWVPYMECIQKGMDRARMMIQQQRAEMLKLTNLSNDCVALICTYSDYAVERDPEFEAWAKNYMQLLKKNAHKTPATMGPTAWGRW